MSAPAPSKPVTELLVSDVVGASREVWSVRSNQTVEQVVAFLASKGVSSAPVLDAEGLLVGSIDYGDILHHMLAFSAKEELSGSWTAFKAIYLSDVSHRNPLLRLTPSHRLTEALELLGSGVHRILIVDEHNRRKVVNILTASDLLRYLDTNSDLIPIKKLMQSVDKMGVGTHAAAGFKLVQVLPTVTAKDAFIKMRLCNVRALPIVDAHGKLVGQISASDIRLLFESGKCNMECLELPCLEYARRVHEKTGRDMLIFVEPDTNLSGVLSTMVKQRVHRVLVTDNLISLAGVISVSDLVELLL